MAVFENKWQKERITIKERSRFMFSNDVLSDVSLVVRSSSDGREAKKSKMAISAHKFMLSICSPVFFAMFCGEMAEKSDSIDLPDCEYEGVLEMLRYMYSGEVELNENNVMQVLYVAKKYILPSLAQECINFLHRNVDLANVVCILSHAQRYDEKSLADQCWELIDRETEEVVKSEEFATIERRLLEALVKRGSLNISEVELFKAVDLWATKDCERQGLAADDQVKRKILGEQIVKGIRFPAMEKEEFVSVVKDSKILTKVEVAELTKNFNGELSTPVGFPDEKRIGTCQLCCRFASFYNDDDDDDDDDDGYDGPYFDAIQFWVDKDVMLHGIRLFGSKRVEYAVSMEITDWQNLELLYDMDKELFQSTPLRHKAEMLDGLDIMFDPFILRKDNIYIVKMLSWGRASCFGTIGADTVDCHGVTFHFEDMKSMGNDTAVNFGQFQFFFKPIL